MTSSTEGCPVRPTLEQMKEKGRQDAHKFINVGGHQSVTFYHAQSDDPLLKYLAWESEQSPLEQLTPAEIAELMEVHRAGAREVIAKYQAEKNSLSSGVRH